MALTTHETAGSHDGQISFLLADAHEGTRQIWRTLLQGIGPWRVASCASLDRVIPKILSLQPDILVIDYYFDGALSTPIVKEIRQSDDRVLNTLPIIGCSGGVSASIVWDLVRAGVDEILTRPPSVAQTWRKVYEVVENRRHFVRTPDYFGPVIRRRAPGMPANVESLCIDKLRHDLIAPVTIWERRLALKRSYAESDELGGAHDIEAGAGLGFG